MLFLEDTLKQFDAFAKVRMLVTAFLLPARVLGRLYGSDGDAESVATVIFSSGNTNSAFIEKY